jgi:hypothetical protein
MENPAWNVGACPRPLVLKASGTNAQGVPHTPAQPSLIEEVSERRPGTVWVILTNGQEMLNILLNYTPKRNNFTFSNVSNYLVLAAFSRFKRDVSNQCAVQQFHRLVPQSCVFGMKTTLGRRFAHAPFSSICWAAKTQTALCWFAVFEFDPASSKICVVVVTFGSCLIHALEIPHQSWIWPGHQNVCQPSQGSACQMARKHWVLRVDGRRVQMQSYQFMSIYFLMLVFIVGRSSLVNGARWSRFAIWIMHVFN